MVEGQSAAKVEQMNETLECLLCGKHFTTLTFHLICKHKITPKEYKERFGVTSVRSEACRQRIGAANKKVGKSMRVNFEKTMLEKYGVKHALLIPASNAKAKATTIKNYGVYNCQLNPEVRSRTDKTMVERYGGHGALCDENVRRRAKEAWRKSVVVSSNNPPKKTKPEILLDSMKIPGLEYTGDWKFWVQLSKDRSKNPDFVVRPFHITRKVVEVFGSFRYFHKKGDDVTLISDYSKVGVKCFVIWDNEINDNSPKLNELKSFVLQGSETTVVRSDLNNERLATPK